MLDRIGKTRRNRIEREYYSWLEDQIGKRRERRHAGRRAQFCHPVSISSTIPDLSTDTGTPHSIRQTNPIIIANQYLSRKRDLLNDMAHIVHRARFARVQ